MKERDARIPVVVRHVVAALRVVSKDGPHHRAEVRAALLNRAEVARQRDASSRCGPVKLACDHGNVSTPSKDRK